MVPFLGCFFFGGGALLNLSGFQTSKLQNVRYSGRAVNGRMTFTHHLRDTSA